MLQKKLTHLLLFLFCLPFGIVAQHAHDERSPKLPTVDGVEPQPLLSHAIRLNDALTFLGSSLSEGDQRKLKELQKKRLTEETSNLIQSILDPYCLAMVNINPEARVKLTRGAAEAKLMQNGWTSFLVKVHNEAGVTAQLKAESPNSDPALHITSFPMQAHAAEKNLLTPGQVANRFLEVQMYDARPLSPNLSGLALEYAVVQMYSKDAGKREVEIGFNIGQGTQDIGFRNSIHILFNIQPSVKVVLNIKDEDGSPTMASFVFSDGIERVIDDSIRPVHAPRADYRFTTAVKEYQDLWTPAGAYKAPARLRGIYPLPSRRVAAVDEYPDFFFQPQVYRKDDEHVLLAPGKYIVTFTRGPEYLSQTQTLVVPAGVTTINATFKLKRWVHMAGLGWYSADHHIHASGCSHYESPEEGVKPEDMWRQIVGEDLNVATVLSWGPGWYHQKQFFTGKTHPLSTSKNIMRYDVEVSGFPSSHAGHIVLLRLKEQDYPGTEQIEDWPSWTSPVLSWAKRQAALTGYAHSGWGLQPIDEQTFYVPAQKKDYDILTYTIPKMDDIGANEYIVTITQNLVDFYSMGDTPAPWELNMWYHSLNCGFRPRISGESDYPCIYDERAGVGRSYFKTSGALSYDGYIAALKDGRSYVSDGGSHITDFSVNGVEVGTKNSEVNLKSKSEVTINAKVASYLPPQQDEAGGLIANRALDKQPYWHIERARLGQTRKVPVELVVNGKAVDTVHITADGKWQNIQFKHTIEKSSWVALRIFPSSHTNPVFVLVDNQPIAEIKSAEWSLQSLDQCWKMKQGKIRPEEKAAAKEAYDKARKVYEAIIQKAKTK